MDGGSEEEFTINKGKLYKITEINNDNQLDAFVIHFVGCEKQIKADLSDFNSEKLMNIFVISIKLQKNTEPSAKLLDLMSKKLNYRKWYVVEFYTNDTKTNLKFFQKQKNSSKLCEVIFSKTNLTRLKLNPQKFTLTFDGFLELVTLLETTIIDLNLNSLKDKLKVNDVKILFKNALLEKDENLIKLFLLYLKELPDEIISHTVEDLDILLLILNNFNPNYVDDGLVKRILSHENTNLNLFFLKIAQNNLLRVFKTVSKNFTNHVSYDDWSEIRKTYLENNFHIFLFFLQQLEEYYVSDSNLFKELHDAIEKKDFDKVQDFVNFFPDFKFCSHEKVCALEKSIDSKAFEIYAFLVSNNFMAFNEEKLIRKILNLPYSEKREIKKFNVKYSKSNPLNFVNILCLKCDLHGYSGSISFSEIREMILKLSKQEEIELILRLAANCESLKIIFDFKNESVISPDPTADDNMMGLTYPDQKLVYVGKNINQVEQYGTFAHEMTHLVLDVVYQNSCLPYCRKDIKRKQKWDEVFHKIRLNYFKNKNISDPIISVVFENYNDESNDIIKGKKIELAVRSIHMIARYLDEPEKLEELRKTYNELFEYFDNFILPDLKTENIFQINEINFKFQKSFNLSETYDDESDSDDSNDDERVADVMHFKTLTNVKICHASASQEKANIKRLKLSENKSSPSLINRELNFVTNKSQKILLSSNFLNLTFLQISKQLFRHSENKLHAKIKNIFVDFKSLEQEYFKNELLSVIESSKLERVFVFLKKVEYCSTQTENLNLLKNLQVQTIFVCDLSNSEFFSKTLNINFQPIKHEWNELNEKFKNKILNTKIIFQNEELKFLDFFGSSDRIDCEILTILFSDQEIEVNCGAKRENKNFITRKFEFKRKVECFESFDDVKIINTLLKKTPANVEAINLSYVEISFNDFIEITKDNTIVLISDQAGSGKTTVLWKVHDNLLKKFPQNWILFVGLKDYIQELSKCVGESFQDFIVKILNLNTLEKIIFNEKFSKGEVKILFDAFDEISPKCKEETLKLFKLFKAQGNKNQIWITTRTHLENDLESELDILAHKLKILDENEQVEFLKIIWDYSENNANILVKKISEMISPTPSVIGLPLIIEGLGKFYKNETDEFFKEKIEKLSISEVYDKIIFKENSETLKLKFPDKVLENAEKADSILKVYYYHAITYMFGDEIAESLGLNFDPDEWVLEEISRGGITNYDKDKNLRFNHETYAEYLIASYLMHMLKTFKNLSEAQIIISAKILVEEKFLITRMLLNDLLENFNLKSLKIKLNSEKFYKHIDKSMDILRFSANECLLNIFEIFLIINEEVFKNLVELKDDETGKTNLMEILPKIKQDKFSEFLDKVIKFYGEKCFEFFLSQVDADGNMILKYLIDKSEENLKTFYEKIKKLLDKEKLKTIIFHQNYDLKTFMHVSMNLKTLKIIFNDKLDSEDLKEFFKLKDEEGRNIFHLSIFYDLIDFNQFYEFFSTIFNQNETKEFYEIVDNNGFNILHLAAKYSITKIFEFLWLKIPDMFFDLKKVFSLKENSGSNILQLSLENKTNPKMFQISFKIAETFYENEDEIKKLIFLKNLRNENILCLALCSASKENLETLFDKISKLCSIDEINILLRSKDGHRNRNIISHLALNPNFECVEFVFKMIEENLSLQEIKIMFFDKDDGNENFFHLASVHAESTIIYKFLYSKIEKYLDETELREFLQHRGFDQKNYLQISLTLPNEFTFFFLFNEVFCKFFDPEDFVYEVDMYGKNFFHYLVPRGSFKMIDSAFKKLEKYTSKENILTFAPAFGQNRDAKLILEKFSKVLGKEKFKVLLTSRGDFSQRRNLLSMASGSWSLTSIKYIWKCYEENFSRNEVKKILYERCETNENFFQLACYTAKSEEIFRFICSRLEKFFTYEEVRIFLGEKTNEQKNYLQLSLLGLKKVSFPYLFEKIYCKYFELKDFIFEFDFKGEYFFHYIARWGTITILKLVFDKFNEKFPKIELRKILTIKSKEHQLNLIHCAAISNFDSTWFQTPNKPTKEFFLDILSQILGDNLFKKMLTEKTANGQHLPIQCAILNNSVEMFKFFVQVYEKYINKDEIKEFLKIDISENMMENNQKLRLMKEAVIEYCKN